AGSGSYRLASNIGNLSPTVNIGGNLILDAGELDFTNGSGVPTVNVAGDVILNGGTMRPTASGGTGVPAFKVAGNWTKNGGTFTPGSGTVTLNGGASQTLSGATT